MWRLLRQISLPYLRESWGRTALVVGGIATGVALIVAIQIINTSVVANLHRTLEAVTGPADLEVTLGIGEVGFPDTAVETVRADDDVVQVVPLVRASVALADDPTETLQLFGIDLTREDELRRYDVTRVGDADAELGAFDPRLILVTEELADRRGLAVGSRIRLAMPRGVATFTVRDLIRASGVTSAFAGQLAIMNLAAAQQHLGKDGRVDQIDVTVKPGTDAGVVAERLGGTLPAGLTVAPPAQRGTEYGRIFEAFQMMLSGLSSLCLVAGVFIVYNTTSTGAVHRARVLVGLLLLGADAARMFVLLMLEALALGMVGALAGVAIGIGLARVLIGLVGESIGVMFQLRLSGQTLTIEPGQAFVVAGLGVGTALFASFFAARSATTVDPLTALRPAMGTQLAPGLTRRLTTIWVVLVAIAAVCIVVGARSRSLVLGNLGATLWDASALIIAVPLVLWLAGALSRTLPRLFGIEGRVAAASLFRAPLRTGFTVAAIALVLTMAITIASVSQSVRQTTIDYVATTEAADLIVSAVSTEGGWLETPIDESIAGEIATLPGIRRLETLRVLAGQMYRGRRISIAATSDGIWDPDVVSMLYREGDPISAGQAIVAGRGAAISTTLAETFGLRLGESITLDSPTGALTLPIVGVVSDHTSNVGSVLFTRRLFVERWGDTMLTRITIWVEPGTSLAAMRTRIATQLGDRHRLKVLALRELLDYHGTKIDQAFAVTGALQLLLAIVTIAGIFDLLVSAIIERRRELALWRLVGAAEGSVRRSVVIESVTIGSIAVLLGIPVGLVTSWIWIDLNVPYFIGYHLDRHFAYGSMVRYTGLILAMTLLAGWAAARRATRQPVLADLRGN